MNVANVAEAMNAFAELIQKVQLGETVTIIDHEGPIARLVAIPPDDPVVRLYELSIEGKIRIPESFGRPWDVDPVPPTLGNTVGALEALFEEREADREGSVLLASNPTFLP